MSGLSVDAGELRERLEVLALRETSPGVWSWEPIRRTWGKVTVDGKSNLFSAVGIGARNAALVVRKQELSLRGGMRWRGQHLFLTQITELDRTHLSLSAALVAVADCLAVRSEDTVGAAGRPVSAETMRISFPGVLTEKYVRYAREETHAETDTSYVLVTPKSIALKPGDVVTVRSGPGKGEYSVTVPHVLDEWKSEYEIVRGRDV